MAKSIGLVGVPSSMGAFAPGQEKAPGALRRAGLLEELARRGFDVVDYGDLAVRRWFPDRAHPSAQHAASVAAVARETAPFVEAVKRVALVAERNTPVRLSFEQGVLILEAGSSDDAQAVERVDAQLDGDDISIAFNPTFLLDGLSAIDSPVAQLSFTTSTKPALLSGKPALDAEADEAYKYLIMPVRLSG